MIVERERSPLSIGLLALLVACGTATRPTRQELEELLSREGISGEWDLEAQGTDGVWIVSGFTTFRRISRGYCATRLLTMEVKRDGSRLRASDGTVSDQLAPIDCGKAVASDFRGVYGGFAVERGPDLVAAALEFLKTADPKSIDTLGDLSRTVDLGGIEPPDLVAIERIDSVRARVVFDAKGRSSIALILAEQGDRFDVVDIFEDSPPDTTPLP